MKEKIALLCDVDVAAVITASDVASVYECPLVFAEQGVDEIALRPLGINAPPRDMTRWSAMILPHAAASQSSFDRTGGATSNMRIL